MNYVYSYFNRSVHIFIIQAVGSGVRRVILHFHWKVLFDIWGNFNSLYTISQHGISWCFQLKVLTTQTTIRTSRADFRQKSRWESCIYSWCVCRIWRNKTLTWRSGCRVLRRRWSRAGRSRATQRSRSDASSTSLMWKSATWATWDRASQSSSTNSHRCRWAASRQSAQVPPCGLDLCLTGSSAEQKCNSRCRTVLFPRIKSPIDTVNLVCLSKTLQCDLTGYYLFFHIPISIMSF